ncbi:sugar phosphate isomerase/epimerase [Stackebrandtia albiflava]|uniref:Sugar phosphate isomerase/epimerase n=1 Tax=Stackebrandtia albiflava TaxID=406432 RepID=A0A562V4W1_9ACTN|nr:sugar phosphate isomerase/epimerase [Stackebrandtia albiflava]TWJ12913.1 sugar phosphate isomerase/epimerase [Stackebrandtia albiflava]
MSATPSPSEPSVQLYSVRDSFADRPVETLRRLHDIGFRQIEAFGITERHTDIRRALDDTGTTCPTAHAGLLDGDPAEAFRAATDLGVHTVIQPFSEPDLWKTVDDIGRIADALNALAPQAASHGLRLGYHNHWWELQTRFDGRTGLDVLADRLDPAVVLEIDVYWATAGGEPAADLLRRLGDRVVAVHVKDGGLALDGSGQAPAGEGVVPLPEILAAAGSALRVVEFDSYDGDVFEGIAAGLRYLRGSVS